MNDGPGRAAYTRQEIERLSDEELVSHFDEREVAAYSGILRGTFAGALEKLPGESTGQHRRRVREAKAIDEQEFQLALQDLLRSALWEKQKGQRFLDLMAAASDLEGRQALEERIRQKDERDRQLAREHGDVSVSGYYRPTWEQ